MRILFFFLKNNKLIYFLYSLLILFIFNLHSSTPSVLCDSISLPETIKENTSNYTFYTGLALITISSLIILYCVAATSNTNYDFLNLFTKDLYTFTSKEAAFINNTLQTIYQQNDLLKQQNEILTQILESLDFTDPRIISIVNLLDQSSNIYP